MPNPLGRVLQINIARAEMTHDDDDEDDDDDGSM